MKWAAALIGLLLLTAQMAADHSDIVRDAAAAYEAGDYETAAALYEMALADGLRHPDLYVNLGAAYYQQAELARAFVAYQRALRLNPRDGVASAMVSRIRAERVDLQLGSYTLLEAVAGLSNGLSSSEITWLALTFWWGWLVLLTVQVLVNWRHGILRDMVMVVGGIALILVLLTALRSYVEAERPLAVVMEPFTEVLSGPGEGYLVVDRLYAAAELRIIDTEGEWLRFVLPDGQQGWLLAAHVERV